MTGVDCRAVSLQAELWALNATRIQSVVRMHHSRKAYLGYLDRNHRATQIQCAWRGFMCFRATRLLLRKVRHLKCSVAVLDEDPL